MATNGADPTTYDALLKEYYTGDVVEDETYEENVQYAMMPKMEDFRGRELPVPILIGGPQGRSADFATAQSRSQATASTSKLFLLQPLPDYSLITIDGKLIRRTQGEKGAFMEAATTEIDGGIRSLARSLAIKGWRTGFGEIGTIATAGISGAVITLANIDEITNVEVGMRLVGASAFNSGALRTCDGSSNKFFDVQAVDRDAGTITATVTLAGTLQAGDTLFCIGDRQDNASPTKQTLTGVDGWIPDTAPTSTLFFNVDRSVDPTRLAGLRWNAGSAPPEEVLVEMGARVAREGRSITSAFANFVFYKALIKQLGSKVTFVDYDANARIAFRGVKIIGARGDFDFYPDFNVKPKRVMGLNLRYWKLYTAGKAIAILDEDGNQMLRQTTADGYEVRYGALGNYGCRAPVSNINVQTN